jgi:hypothetical protein
MEEKVNFEQLKKDVLNESKNDYPAKISVGNNVNTPMLKMVFDYFNVLNDKKKLQKDHGLTVQGFIDNRNEYMDNLPERAQGSINVKVELLYKDEFSLFVVLSRFMTDGKWFCNISATSNKSTYVSSDFIYKKIIYSAISHSNLKASYFVMPPNELGWEVKSLEKRDFSDVYLPKKIMQKLELFTGLYEKKGEIMRYLFAGTPGTGKTEATIAIANILQKQGVTIIKTTVCDALKEKIELAELLSPSLIILDDLDLSLGSRSKGGFSRSLGTFLDALDGTDKISAGVGIIATTNSIELLDEAASRPGRFDKLMSFDEITKENIEKLILKSLKHNFGFSKTHPAFKIFSDKKIVEFFHNSKMTGSAIFNNVKMIMRTIEILSLDMKDCGVDWIISEIEQEIITVRTIRNSRYLQSGELKGEDNSKKIGLSSSEYEEDEDEYVDESAPLKGFLHEDVDVPNEQTYSESDESMDEMPDNG